MMTPKYLLLLLCLGLFTLGSLRGDTGEQVDLKSPLMMIKGELSEELKEAASRDSSDQARKSTHSFREERLSDDSSVIARDSALFLEEQEEEKQRPFAVEEPDSRHAEEALEALDDRSSEMKRGSSSSQEEPQAGEKELKTTKPDFMEQWAGLTAGQKKATITARWKSAIQQEPMLLEQVRQTMMIDSIARASFWNAIVEQAEQLTTAWTEIAACYEEEKEAPPYWIPFRWQSDLKTAKYKSALWSARLAYYKGEQALTDVYLTRGESKHIKIESVALDPVIDKTIQTAFLLQQAVSLYEDGYASAEGNLKKEWNAELEEVKERRRHNLVRLNYYAGQGGRSAEPEIAKLTKLLDPPRQEPSPLDRPSEREKEDYRGVKLLEYKEFVDPDPVANPEGYQVHIRILKRKKKIDPYMRVEEWIDGTGALIKRSEMAADHLLIDLKEGMTEESLLKELEEKGCHGCSLRRVITKAVPLYRLYITPREPEKWEEVWEQAVNAVKELGLEWEPNFFFTLAM